MRLGAVGHVIAHAGRSVKRRPSASSVRARLRGKHEVALGAPVVGEIAREYRACARAHRRMARAPVASPVSPRAWCVPRHSSRRCRTAGRRSSSLSTCRPARRRTLVSTLPPLTVMPTAGRRATRVHARPPRMPRRRAFGHVVRHGENRAHRAREFRIRDFHDAAHVGENDRERIGIRLAAGHAVAQLRFHRRLDDLPRGEGFRKCRRVRRHHADDLRARRIRHCARPRRRKCRSPGRWARRPRPDPARRGTAPPSSW